MSPSTTSTLYGFLGLFLLSFPEVVLGQYYPGRIPGQRRIVTGVMTVHVSVGESYRGQGSEFRFRDAGCVDPNGRATVPTGVEDCGLFRYSETGGLESISLKTRITAPCYTVPFMRTRPEIERLRCNGASRTSYGSGSNLELFASRGAYQLANPDSPMSMFGVTRQIMPGTAVVGTTVDLYTQRPQNGRWAAVLFKPVDVTGYGRSGLFGAAPAEFSIASKDLPPEVVEDLVASSKEEGKDVKDVKEEPKKEDKPKEAKKEEGKEGDKKGKDEKKTEKKGDDKVKIEEPAIA